MAKKEGAKEKLGNQMMLGIDLEERKISDFFDLDNDFDETKDGKQIFVRHDGLLRAAKRAFGGIKRRVSKPMGVPVKEDNWCAVVNVGYQFESGHKVEAVADCRSDTANRGFGKYTTALAETRASGRALKFALGLEIVTQEEIADIEDIIDQAAREPALEHQKALIKKKFIGERGKTFEQVSKILKKKVVTLDQLTRGEATEILEAFNSE